MARRCWFLAALVPITLSLSVAGCGSGASKGGGSGAAGATGVAGTTGASGTTDAAGTTGAAGAVTGAAGDGAAGTSVAGAAGSSTGTAGTAGAAGDGTMSGAAGTTDAGTPSDGPMLPPLPDPGTDGDGDFMIGPGFTIDPANRFSASVPLGRQFAFIMNSADSKIYPGRGGTAYMRHVWVYVPMQYVPGTAAPFIMVQDGNYAVWFGNDVPHAVNTGGNLPGTANLPRILDNLIAAKKLPKLVAIFAEAGGGDGGNSERGLEYDTVSGTFAEYVESEVLPRVVTEAQAQLKLALAFTKDPQGRGTLGGSSGGAGSFSMAWWHPDLFSRVITYSGTFVRQASPENPLYPHGCWCYHDFDPYNAAAPNGLIVMEPTQKPIRHWLEVGTADMGSGGGPSSYRDFQLASQRMAASYKAKNYHYHFDLAQGAGHLDGGAVAQTLPSALLYVWRGYPID
jgi:enterochelin esterase family protein